MGLTWDRFQTEIPDGLLTAILWEHDRQHEQELRSMFGKNGGVAKTPELNILRKDYLEEYWRIARAHGVTHGKMD